MYGTVALTNRVSAASCPAHLVDAVLLAPPAGASLPYVPRQAPPLGTLGQGFRTVDETFGTAMDIRSAALGGCSQSCSDAESQVTDEVARREEAALSADVVELSAEVELLARCLSGPPVCLTDSDERLLGSALLHRRRTHCSNAVGGLIAALEAHGSCVTRPARGPVTCAPNQDVHITFPTPRVEKVSYDHAHEVRATGAMGCTGSGAAGLFPLASTPVRRASSHRPTPSVVPRHRWP